MDSSDNETCDSLCKEHYFVLHNFTTAMRKDLDWEMLLNSLDVLSILSITMLVGIIGNIHVIIVYAQYYKQNNFRLCVLFLSAVDLVGCCISIPLKIVYNFQYFTIFNQSLVLCKLCNIPHVLYMVSITILGLIGADRLRRTTKPLGKQLTHKQMKITIFLCCVPSFVLFGVSMFTTTFDAKVKYSCNMNRGDDYIIYIVQNVIIDTFNLSLCLILNMTLLSFLLYKTSKYSNCSCSEKRKDYSQAKGCDNVYSVANNINTIRRSSYMKGVRAMFVFIFVALVSCLLSLPASITISSLFIKCHNLRACNTFTDTMANNYNLFSSLKYMNHCINPIIFGLADKQFRKKCKQLYVYIKCCYK